MMMNNTNTKMMMAAVERVITHSGVFHSDDVTCVALIELVKGSEVEVLRPDRNVQLADIDTSSTDIIVDVFGGEFDHHKEEKFDGDRKLSSLGLIYRAYKNEIMNALGILPRHMNRIEKVVEEVDFFDNGGKIEGFETSFNNIISSFNGNPGQNDQNFRSAVNFVKIYLQNLIKDAQDASKQDMAWDDKKINKKIVELDGFVRDWEARAKAEGLDIEFACTFEPWASQFSIQRVRESQANIKQLLEGVEGVKFAHPAGFLAKIEIAAKDAILAKINA